MLYQGCPATSVAGRAAPSPPPPSAVRFSSPSSSSSKGLAGDGGVLGPDSSPLREDREPESGGVACPAAGGAGAFFFLCSDWTKASQGGSLGLWVPLDKLDGETDTDGGVTRGKTSRSTPGHGVSDGWNETADGKTDSQQRRYLPGDWERSRGFGGVGGFWLSPGTSHQ